ncbi:MAG: hypothetical protein JNG89_19135 [Planctomycetaceae bacterium]|nr:hypothetical protein [Planctomycetaceae bacterium]
MTHIQISLTDEVAKIIDREVKARGLAGPGEFIEALVLQESTASRTAIDALILEGLDSGPAFPVDEEWWERKRAELQARLEAEMA